MNTKFARFGTITVSVVALILALIYFFGCQTYAGRQAQCIAAAQSRAEADACRNQVKADYGRLDAALDAMMEASHVGY